MIRIDKEVIQQRMMDLQKEARQYELARRNIASKREKRKSFLGIFLTIFRR
ncbi:hypothetical protein [Lederbergia lenta]|nr:hypothetical protein [Lederbergia lenta]MCM3113163.1 hypothetical protein [Lederbergia lenta]MEC2326049.1 hypothetical protein [Lederbergia lenta]